MFQANKLFCFQLHPWCSHSYLPMMSRPALVIIPRCSYSYYCTYQWCRGLASPPPWCVSYNSMMRSYLLMMSRPLFSTSMICYNSMMHSQLLLTNDVEAPLLQLHDALVIIPWCSHSYTYQWCRGLSSPPPWCSDARWGGRGSRSSPVQSPSPNWF